MAIEKSLEDVTLLSILDLDPQPTFILDAKTAAIHDGDSIFPVYRNSALVEAQSGDLLDGITREDDVQDHSLLEFRSWANNVSASTSDPGIGPSEHFLYADYAWTKLIFLDRWILISGISINTVSDLETTRPGINVSKGRSTNSNVTSRSSNVDAIPLTGTIHSSFDWTDEHPPTNTTPHIDFARGIDWASTPLGPMRKWSTQLRSSANLVMQDPRPAVIFWGQDLIMIYNEPYVELIRELHPMCMGTSARIALAGVWDHFEIIITKNLAGETVEETNKLVFITRAGFLEETYFSLKFMPVFNTEGATIGHYQTVFETTEQQILQRRLSTLLELSDEVPRARDVPSYWSLATEVLSRNDKDVPFALLYSVESEDVVFEGTSSISSHSPTRNDKGCILRGSIGLDESSSARPSYLDFSQDYGFMPYFRQAILSQDPITLHFDQDELGLALNHGIKSRGFGDPCRAAAIFAIYPASSTKDPVGFIVIGLNPRTPYDDDYQRFILVASRLLSTSLTSILLHEEEISRSERAMAQAETMKIELMEKLLITQKELERNSLKFQRFAERSDVGIFIVGLDGVYSYRNKAWYEICKQDIKGQGAGDVDDAWNEIVEDKYAEFGREQFALVVKDKSHQSFELKLKRTWTIPDWSHESISEEQPIWVLTSVFPELTDDGEVVEIVGSITDISRQKWGEKMQAARASDAQESKKQLENFIDTTSHEMRNPLSAVIQCADGIITAHQNHLNITEYGSTPRLIAETCIDAAETIVQCSQHMKCIVDDVLTMSKLDSGLLVMTPVNVQPEIVVHHAMKMFEGEAKAAGVDLGFKLEDSWFDHSIHWVSLDPTRLLQILINLITNAIKFTRFETTRHVSVSMGISLERPERNESGEVTYNNKISVAHAPRPLPESLLSDWEKGQVVYICFTVQDTGRGLSDTEKDLLFARFSQASPRTHIHYGGSGLGLFICRRLTEMHGGSIGFSSNSGSGSTFAFYVKGRKGHASVETSADSFNPPNFQPQIQLPSPQHHIEPNAMAGAPRPAENITDILEKEDVRDIAQGLHILIVEDNLVNQRVLAKQLKNLGIIVSVANHGGEALEYLQKTRFCDQSADSKELSLILMDWEMPVMDGLTCVRKIRELQKNGKVKGHVPVIAVTANVRSEQVKVAMDAGMDDVVSKPFRLPELYECIRRLFSGMDTRG